MFFNFFKKKTAVDYLEKRKEYLFSCFCVFETQEDAEHFSKEMKKTGLKNTIELSQNKEKWWVQFEFKATPKSKEHIRIEKLLKSESKKMNGEFGLMNVSDPSSPGMVV